MTEAYAGVSPRAASTSSPSSGAVTLSLRKRTAPSRHSTSAPDASWGASPSLPTCTAEASPSTAIRSSWQAAASCGRTIWSNDGADGPVCRPSRRGSYDDRGARSRAAATARVAAQSDFGFDLDRDWLRYEFL